MSHGLYLGKELKPGAKGGDPAGAADDAAGAEAFARALPLLFTILGLKL